jgi:hypothetical protein
MWALLQRNKPSCLARVIRVSRSVDRASVFSKTLGEPATWGKSHKKSCETCTQPSSFSAK